LREGERERERRMIHTRSTHNLTDEVEAAEGIEGELGAEVEGARCQFVSEIECACVCVCERESVCERERECVRE
jgi:hypothetical protein